MTSVEGLYANVKECFLHADVVGSHGLVSKAFLTRVIHGLCPQLSQQDVRRVLELAPDREGFVQFNDWMEAMFDVPLAAEGFHTCNASFPESEGGSRSGCASRIDGCPAQLAGQACSPAAIAAVPTPARVDTARELRDGTVFQSWGDAESVAQEATSILALPWRHGLASFFGLPDLCWLCAVSATLCADLTVRALDGRRVFVLPVVELHKETATTILQLISPLHIQTLRIWHRSSFDAVAMMLQSDWRNKLQSIERIAIKACPLFVDDFRLSLTPVFLHVGGLKHLNLERNQVNDQMLKDLVDSGALAAARLESINLRFNRIGAAGAEALASCRKGFSRLKWLNLKMNCLGDEGAQAMAAIIAQSSSLTLMNLRRQTPALTDRAAAALAEAWCRSATLEQLRLRRNRIRDSGAAALAVAVRRRLADAKALLCHAPQLELDLEDNCVGAKGAFALLCAVAPTPLNLGKIEVLLHGNSIKHEGLRRYVAELPPETPLVAVVDADDRRIAFQTKPESAL